jgi:hypothetical protein
MKEPIPPLSIIPIKGEGARPEAPPSANTPKRVVPKEQVMRVAMTFRPIHADHQKLKRLAHETGHSMQEFLDEAIREWLVARGLD